MAAHDLKALRYAASPAAGPRARPRRVPVASTGLLCRIVCVLLFVGWTAESPLEKVLYCGYWRSPFEILGPLFVAVPSVNLFPWQMLVMVLAPLCLVRPGAFRKRAAAMDGVILAALAAIGVTFTWGWLRGGSPYQAYYQLWKLLLALLLGLMLPCVLRGSRALRALGLTVLLAALVRGTLAMYFYWAIVRGRIVPPPPYMTTHDDSLLFVAGVIVALSWALARRTLASWLAAALVSAHLFYAITLNDRRLAWIELLVSLGLIYAALPRGRVNRRVNQFLLAAAPLLVLYVVAGWDSSAPAFAPVKALSTAGRYDDNSSMAREEEIRNLLYTLSAGGNPLLGVGWGIPYQKVTSVYANLEAVWSQYLYLPHNSLLGVVVFGGLAGLTGISSVLAVAAFLAVRGYRGTTEVIDGAAAMAALCLLPAYAIQCYGDIGLQSLTGNLLLGMALGVAAKVAAWARPLPEARSHGGPRIAARRWPAFSRAGGEG